MSVHKKLEQLGIVLPPVTAPVAAFLPSVQVGKLVFLSGHIAKLEGKPWAGQLGRELNTNQGKEAARLVAIDLIGTLNACVEDLDRVTRIVKLMVLVNSTPDFTEQHLVANGASELLIDIFGEAGRHVRTAFGVAQIPFGACVEIDLIAEFRS